MVINNLEIRENSLLFSVDCVEDSTPCVMRRVSPDLWRYHDKRVLVRKLNSNTFILDENFVFEFFDLGIHYCVCDVICHDSRAENDAGLIIGDIEKYKTFSADVVYEKNFGTVKVCFYINASRALSMRLSFIPKTIFHILKLSEDDNYINFRFKSDFHFENADIALACRENTEHNYHYRFLKKFDIISASSENDKYFRIAKRAVLENLFLKDRDVLDIVVIMGDTIFPCYAENDLSTNYFKVQIGFEACCFVSENKYSSIFVRRIQADDQEKKIKVAILGSCFTKEAFHSLKYLNPDYKLFYENGLTAFHSSIISLVSRPVEYDLQDLEGSLDRKTIDRYGERELSKTFFDELQSYSPDYLIVDLYVETAAHIYELSNDCYLTDSYYFKGTQLANKLKFKRKISIYDDERFLLFKQALIKFREKIEGIIPLKNIVLIKARRAVNRIDNGIVTKWPQQEYIKYANKLWDKCDELFERIFPEARIIDMRNDDKYLSQKQSPLSFSPQYLVDVYYKDLLNNFNKIVLYDLINNLV